MKLRSPLTGNILHRDGHALVGSGGERWPVVDGIPFLRADRTSLASEVLARLDANDADGALILLLREQDPWAKLPPPTALDCARLIGARETLSLREAMELLALGGVATYFAHRWSDPTFLSGLALAEAHWTAPECVLEIACGIGHFLRAFAPHAARVIGADLVFPKLWLARHWVAPTATLLCFDVAQSWPLADDAADLVFCHDAFYFLPDKAAVAAEMRRVGGVHLVGHLHNALVENHSAGAPLPPAEYADLLGAEFCYDDHELTCALVNEATPRSASVADLATTPAMAVSAGAGAPRALRGVLAQPASGTLLRRNPLYVGGELVWPSTRYRDEYASLATYPYMTDAPAQAVAGNAAVDALARRRVMLDLPARW